MIIYGEDLSRSGLSADELKEKGKAHDRWRAIEKSSIEDRERQVQITSLAR